MPIIDVNNAETQFADFFYPHTVEVSSVILSTATTFMWLGGEDIDGFPHTRNVITATGSFSYDVDGSLISGTITDLTFDLSANGNLDIVISEIPDFDILPLFENSFAFSSNLFRGDDLFTGTFNVPGSLFGDALTATGDFTIGGDDTFDLSFSGPDYIELVGDIRSLGFTENQAIGGNDIITLGGSTSSQGISIVYGDVWNLEDRGNLVAGNDTINTSTYTSRIAIYGDARTNYGMLVGGDDFIIGGVEQNNVLEFFDIDLIYGDVEIATSASITEGGDDTIVLVIGRNIVAGDAQQASGEFTAGNDYILGGSGADLVSGDARFVGNGYELRVIFQGGNDFISAGANDDILHGDIAGVRITVTASQNSLITFGSDTIHGGEGNDLIWGDFQSDLNGILADDAGATDYLFGDEGADTIHGNGGSDWIYGGDDNDTLNGGAGADLIFGEHGSDTINGGDDGDFIWGGSDNDTIHGNEGADWLRGEAGIDMLFGDEGDDILFGGAGDDIMEGGTGMDTLYGAADNDIINGGSEGDFLFGGAGQDTINGGTENDLMWGDMPGMGDGVEDIFVFEDNWGFDAIYDFELGIDQISMGAVTGLTQFSDLTVFDGGANVTVAFAGNAITLYGVTFAELNANQADFDFT